MTLRGLRFAALVVVLLVVGVLVAPHPLLAMGFGLLVAGYSAIANDSIQTIGTFIESNRHQPRLRLWLWLGSILAVTLLVGWWTHAGDPSFGRLATKGFETSPTSFTVFQVIAPVVLLVLTRYRVPVSTSFLLLACFATSMSGIEKMLVKSLSGYGVSFVTAFVLWTVVLRRMTGTVPESQRHAWTVAQWISTGALWSTWLVQDAANIVVFLPRTLDALTMVLVVLVLLGALGVLIFRRGGEIQQVVHEKSGVEDIRNATVIDATLAFVLFGYTAVNPVPMSTTWAFLGLLAGREIARTVRHDPGAGTRRALGLAGKDLARAALGLLVSLALAALANPGLFSR